MALRVRHKLIILGTLVILVVSSAFTWINLALAQRAIEEDLKARAIVYARDVAVTLGQRRELGSPQIEPIIRRLIEIRRSVQQVDVLVFTPEAATVVATNAPETPLPFTEADGDEVRHGGIVSRRVAARGERHWEVMAPITLDGAVAGAVAVKFSALRADELASRIRWWALTLTAVSVVIMGVLMRASIQLVVDQPIRRFMKAIAAGADDGVPAPVTIGRRDEFGVLADHFNEMAARSRRFNDELKTRIESATGELDRRYRELADMQRRLGRAERLALSGRVMAEVAHEIGTPLHSVAGHLELLRRDLEAGTVNDDVTRRLTIIETQVVRVIDIITRLLDITRVPAGQSVPVDIDPLVRDTVDLVRPTATNAGLSLDPRLGAAPARVQGRRDHLQQVLLNLLTNAIDATPRGGRITVTTRHVAAKGEVEVAVADTGRGIPLADHQQVFEPFFSTKEPGYGAGLGLFISAEIVREHKGRIELDSEDGRGSTFRVLLPGVEPGP